MSMDWLEFSNGSLGLLDENATEVVNSTNSSFPVTAGNESSSTGVPPPQDGCPVPSLEETSLLGLDLAVPAWEAVLTAFALSAIILLTVVGNILVILSVFTHKPLRIVQNFFIVSLAVADLTVAVLVLPLNVAYSLVRRWIFGIHVCKLWLTCDVLCCTASILNLCAIALDRYWAITDPINYAQKRTVRRVLLMIAGVWLLSLLISSPPLAGWNDWPEEFDRDTPCQLTSQQGYVIYSSLGSFYIPLAIMTLVYIEIFVATKRRLRERAKASRINVTPATAASPTAASVCATTPAPNMVPDGESVSSETSEGRIKRKKRRKKGSVERRRKECLGIREDSVTDVGNHYQEVGTGLTSAGNSPRHATNNHQDAGNGVKTLKPETTGTCPSPGLLRPPNANPAPVFTVTQPVTPAVPVKKNSVYQFIEERQRISLSKERRAARTLGIIMGVFVVCWLPFFLMYVILPFCPSCCPSEKLVNFVTWLGYINSALNPIIYTIFNLDFRRAFKKLLHMKGS